MFNKDGDAPIEIVGRVGVMLDNIRGTNIARAEVIHENKNINN